MIKLVNSFMYYTFTGIAFGVNFCFITPAPLAILTLSPPGEYRTACTKDLNQNIIFSNL